MFQHLQIYERRERALVGTADMALRVVGPVARALRRRASAPPRRVLVLRIERIGDLLMSLEAIADVVAALPNAEVDLVVGSWNEAVARAIPGIHRVETLDAAWLAREGAGAGMAALLSRARRLARAVVRSRAQLRARYPEQPARRDLRRGQNGRFLERRRRTAAGYLAPVRPAVAHER